jgi:hypothetical protein
MLEGLVFLVIVAGVVWVVKLGCQGKRVASKTSPVTCPTCGVKLELKEAGR